MNAHASNKRPASNERTPCQVLFEINAQGSLLRFYGSLPMVCQPSKGLIKYWNLLNNLMKIVHTNSHNLSHAKRIWLLLVISRYPPLSIYRIWLLKQSRCLLMNLFRTMYVENSGKRYWDSLSRFIAKLVFFSSISLTEEYVNLFWKHLQVACHAPCFSRIPQPPHIFGKIAYSLKFF